MDDTENSEEAASHALEVAGVEETLPEASPQIDHSQLYVWVADSGNDRIQKFDGNGKLLMNFGHKWEVVTKKERKVEEEEIKKS